jgi:hypothetical protein
MEFPPGYLVNQEGGQLQNMLSKLTYDSRLLGEMLPIHLDIHMPLKELGITDLEEILCRGRQHQQRVLSASELCKKFGKVVKKRHMVDLNRLTLLLNDSFKHHNIMA